MSSIVLSRRAREEMFTARCHDYLLGIEVDLQCGLPALHATFDAQGQENLDGCSFSEETRERLASASSRLAVLVGFLRERGVSVLELLQWDRRVKSEGWPGRSVTGNNGQPPPQPWSMLRMPRCSVAAAGR